MIATAVVYFMGGEGIGLGLLVGASLAAVYLGQEFGSES